MGSEFVDHLLSIYGILPFREHPLWKGVKSMSLSKEQVLLAETQHYLRTRAGRDLRRRAMEEAQGDELLLEAIFETYLEECTDKDGPSHLELIGMLLRNSGVTQRSLDEARPTPGNAAAIALYADIARRGTALHIIGAGVVEHHYAVLCADVFHVYTNGYGFSGADAETYRVHESLDRTHAERAFRIADHATTIYGSSAVEMAVRDAFVATSLHYDGMLQAATGRPDYWNGEVTAP